MSSTGKDSVSVQFNGPAPDGGCQVDDPERQVPKGDEISMTGELAHAARSRERFSSFCRRLGISPHAEKAWNTITNQSLEYLVAMVAAGVMICGLRVWLFVGAVGLPYGARLCLQLLAGLTIFSDGGVFILMWQFGPSFHGDHPIVANTLVLGAYLGSMPVYFAPLLAPERLVPFQSRFLFLICMAGLTVGDVIIGDFLIKSVLLPMCPSGTTSQRAHSNPFAPWTRFQT